MILTSIRLRLTGWFAVALMIFVLASGGVWYWRLSRSHFSAIDSQLAIVTDDFYQHHLPPNEVFHPCAPLRAFLAESHLGIAAAVLSDRGELLCTSSDGFTPAPPQNAAFATIPNGKSTYGGTDADYRVLRQDLAGKSLIFFFPLKSYHKSLDELVEMLLVLSPVAAGLIFLLGWFVAGRALYPVRQMALAVQKIGAGNLSARLPVGKTRDELTLLADTFNSMLARLEDSFKRVSQFNADASHELRTPLAILRGETEIALKFSKTPEEFRQVLESNMEEIERMAKIIEGLLDLTKASNGRNPLHLAEFDLPPFLADIFDDARMLGEFEEKRVETLIAEDLPATFLGDQLRLHQALLNLITNAVKYTPSGGIIRLTAGMEDEQLAVTIADTGIGIAAEHLPHIFDRFYRVDPDRNRKIGGTGLGLSIVHWIVEAHGGSIDVSSEPGVGTSFHLLLPLRSPEA